MHNVIRNGKTFTNKLACTFSGLHEKALIGRRHFALELCSSGFPYKSLQVCQFQNYLKIPAYWSRNLEFPILSQNLPFFLTSVVINKGKVLYNYRISEIFKSSLQMYILILQGTDLKFNFLAI